MGLITVQASAAISSGAASDEVPTEFVLLRAGKNTYYGDGEMVFDAEAASSVMAKYQKRGLELMADYEHQSLSFKGAGPVPAAAKKWTPEVRNGDLVAANIKWTPRAKQMLQDGEYRYFSIACRVNQETKRVVEVINFALTNNPAADAIQPLVAASLTASEELAFQKDNTMKTVIVALGLSADAEETTAVAKASRLVEFERDVIALTKTASLSEAMGSLQAMKASHEQVAALSATVRKMEADKTNAEIQSLLDAVVADGKVTPGEKPELLALGAKYGLEAVQMSLKGRTRIVATAAEQPKESGGEVVEMLSAVDKQIARQMVGNDAAKFKAHCDELRAYRAEKLELKRSGFGR